MKIASIKSGIRIKGELLIDWDEFIEHLRGYLSDFKETSIDSETVGYHDGIKTYYEMSVIGHKRIHLKVESATEIKDIDYVVEFQKIGTTVAFTFLGLEEDFSTCMMNVNLAAIFDTFTINKHVVREHVEFVMYD